LITATCGGSPPKYTWDNFTCDEKPVQAPNLLEAVFTDSALQIRVKLEAAASQWTFKGLFSCSTLFQINSGAASCEWLGDDELMMTLHEGALGHSSVRNSSAGGSTESGNGCFRPGTSLQLKTGALESIILSGSSATSSLSGAGVVQVKLPKTTTPLTIAFGGVSMSGLDNVVLGKCDDLSIEAQVHGTTGTCSATVTWQVRDNITGVVVFSATGNQLQQQASMIADGSYEVEARVENTFLAGQADVVRTLRMVKLDETLPTVEIKGELRRSAPRERTLRLDGDARVPVCRADGGAAGGSSASISGQEYGDYSYANPSSSSSSYVNMTWTITPISPEGKTGKASDLGGSLAQYVFNGGRTLILRNYLLEVRWQYLFTLEATTSNSRRASVAVTVVVPRTSPVANIDGGNVRRVGSGGNLSFNASGSYDPDQSTGKASSSTLTFAWVCLVHGITATKPCQTRMGTDQIFSSASVVTLSYLPPYGYLEMTVTVTRKVRSAGRRLGDDLGDDKADYHLFTQAVKIAGPGSFPPRVTVGSIQLAGQRYANPSRSLRISGVVIPGKPGQHVEFEWKCDDLDMSNRALFLTPVKNQLSLVIRPNVLKPRSYTFQLHASEVAAGAAASEKGSSVSYAEITVAVNTPPISGSLSVFPVRGHSTTRFKGTASGWEDSPADLPLLYRFASSFTTLSSERDDGGLRFLGSSKESESQVFFLPTPPTLSAARLRSSYAAYTSITAQGRTVGVETPSPIDAPCHVWVEVSDQFMARSRASTSITMVAKLTDLYNTNGEPSTTTGSTTGGSGSSPKPAPVEITSIAGKNSTMRKALGSFLEKGQAEDALQTIGALGAILNERYMPPSPPSVTSAMVGGSSSGSLPRTPLSKEEEEEAKKTAEISAAKATELRHEALTLREELITSISDAEKSAGASVETWTLTTQALAAVTAQSSQLSKKALTSAQDLLSRTLFNYRRAAIRTAPMVDAVDTVDAPSDGSPSNMTNGLQGFEDLGGVRTTNEALATGDDVDEFTTSMFVDHASDILSSLLEAGTQARARAEKEAADALNQAVTSGPNDNSDGDGQGGNNVGGGGEHTEDEEEDELGGLVKAIEELSRIMVAGRVPGEDASTVAAKNLALKVERTTPHANRSFAIIPPELKPPALIDILDVLDALGVDHADPVKPEEGGDGCGSSEKNRISRRRLEGEMTTADTANLPINVKTPSFTLPQSLGSEMESKFADAGAVDITTVRWAISPHREKKGAKAEKARGNRESSDVFTPTAQSIVSLELRLPDEPGSLNITNLDRPLLIDIPLGKGEHKLSRLKER
jgi:hypothetical protein